MRFVKKELEKEPATSDPVSPAEDEDLERAQAHKSGCTARNIVCYRWYDTPYEPHGMCAPRGTATTGAQRSM